MDLPGEMFVTRGDYGDTRICVSHMDYFGVSLEAITPLVNETKTLKELIPSVCLSLYKVYNNTNYFFFMHTSISVNTLVSRMYSFINANI